MKPKIYSHALKLPRNFRFCIATSAHQIEGGNVHSDWWQWERTPGKIKNGHTSEIATDSWNHLETDIANLKDLGIDTYRFSVEWAKIEPREGEIRGSEIDRYVELIERLKREGIESMITLHHFTLPEWLAEKGGWEWPGIVDAFAHFVSRVAKAVGDRIDLWITLNEPMGVLAAGYMSDVFPPGRNDLRSFIGPMENMIRAHAKAYHIIHDLLDTTLFKPRVGLAHHLRIFDPKRKLHPLDWYLSRKFDEIFNWALPGALTHGRVCFSLPTVLHASFSVPDAIGTQDFFGLNYYSRDFIGFHLGLHPPISRTHAVNARTTDLDWEIYPEGLGRLISKIRRKYGNLPVWITENGLADSKDQNRIEYIRSHLHEIAEALDAGCVIEGYCHWTLNDNFEWAEGYHAHFGLYALEPQTLKRIPRPSAKNFSQMIQDVKQNSPR